MKHRSIGTCFLIIATGLALFGFKTSPVASATGLFAVAACPARLQGVTLGPIMVISDPDPAAAIRIQNWSNGTNETELETNLAVNPANPDNIVAIWRAHDGSADAVSVTLDGGSTWQNVAIPGISAGVGGTYPDTADPWISFAPNGILYAINLGFGGGLSNSFVSRSVDGGLTWGSPILLGGGTGASYADKPSVTADSANSNYVYAMWNTGILGGPATNQFARTTDGGHTWQSARSIYDAPTGNSVWDQHIEVLPNGVLVCVFTELTLTGFNVKGVPQYTYALSVQRSADKGQTWSAPVKVASQQPRTDPNPSDFPWWATVTDPSNNHGIAAPGMGKAVAVNPRNGILYAVWIDARFGGGPYNSIAFSQSTDAGLTWSAPIKVNQTPDNILTPDRQAMHPTIAVAADGTIGVTYYDLRFDASGHGCTADYWLATCTPTSPSSSANPASWANETRLTDASFDVEDCVGSSIGGATAYWVGDYQGLATVGNTFVAAWGQPYGTSPNRILFRKVGP